MTNKYETETNEMLASLNKLNEAENLRLAGITSAIEVGDSIVQMAFRTLIDARIEKEIDACAIDRAVGLVTDLFAPFGATEKKLSPMVNALMAMEVEDTDINCRTACKLLHLYGEKDQEVAAALEMFKEELATSVAVSMPRKAGPARRSMSSLN